MSDKTLVERLRSWRLGLDDFSESILNPAILTDMDEAADEIERLTAERDALRAEVGRLNLQVESLQNKWASRPIDHPNGEALGILNDNLSDENDALRSGLARIAQDEHAFAGCTGCQDATRIARSALEGKP